jgi:hypothetical protein
MLRIRRVKPIQGYRVQLTLTNGDVVERDLEAVLWGPVFAELRADLSKFQKIRVSNGTIMWPGNLDFDPETVIWGRNRPTDPAARPPGFLALGR